MKCSARGIWGLLLCTQPDTALVFVFFYVSTSHAAHHTSAELQHDVMRTAFPLCLTQFALCFL